jgi:NADH-quinone oxidoreductase subunit K
MIVPFAHVVILAAVLFALGLLAVLTRRNLVMLLIGVEVMVNAAALVLVGASALHNQIDGQAFVIFLMGLTPAEVALALATIVYLHRRKRSLDVDALSELRG